MSPEQHLQKEADTWSKLWNPTGSSKGETDELIKSLNDVKQIASNSPPVEILIEDLMEAIKKYNKDSRGIDGWQASEFQALPKCMILKFLRFLNLSFQKISNPHQCLTSINPLLGKPGGGVRTVCLTPMPYRLLCKASQSPVKQ